MKRFLVIALLLLTFSSVPAQVENHQLTPRVVITQEPEATDIGDGFFARIEKDDKFRAFMLIKFPDKYLGTPELWLDGTATALVKIFTKGAFKDGQPTVIGEGTLEGHGRYLYVDTYGAKRFRIAFFPLFLSNEDPKLVGMLFTLMEIPVVDRVAGNAPPTSGN